MTDNSNFFDQILQTCIQAVTEQGKTVEECLQRFPEQRNELEPLLRLALRLQKARSVQPSAEFQHGALARMHNLTAAHPQAVEAPSAPATRTILSTWADALRGLRQGFHASFRPVFAVVLIMVILLVSITGVGYAASSALPGQQLYPVKTWIETARLNLSPSDYTDARLHFEYAQLRLTEAADVTAAQQSQSVPAGQILAYQNQLQSAARLLETSSSMTPAQKTYVAGDMVRKIPAQGMILSGLAKNAPPSMEPAFTDAYRQLIAAYELAAGVMKENDALVDLPADFPSIPTLPYDHPTQAAHTPQPVAMASPFPTFPSFTGTATIWMMDTPWPTGCPTAWPTGWPSEWKTCDISQWPTGIPTGFPSSWPTEWPTQLQTYLPTNWQTLVPTFHTLPSVIPTLEYLPTYIGTFIPDFKATVPPVPWDWPTVEPPPGWPPVDDDPPPGNPEPPPGFPWPPDSHPSWP